MLIMNELMKDPRKGTYIFYIYKDYLVRKFHAERGELLQE